MLSVALKISAIELLLIIEVASYLYMLMQFLPIALTKATESFGVMQLLYGSTGEHNPRKHAAHHIYRKMVGVA